MATVSHRIAEEIAWRSDDPHLGGNFAPVGPEIEADALEVVAGRIPPELRGAYLRNGPNPLFKPLSYTYPMDGDGMVHGVTFAGGRASYRNRFVRTRGLAVERRADRAVYGGLLGPVPVDPALVGEDGEAGPYKNGAYIHVIRHGGRILALSETATAYELSWELNTLGEWTAGGGRPLQIGAHNRRHCRTGELYGLAYSVTAPEVTIHRIDCAGRLRESRSVALSAPSMIHDFVLSERFLVLVIGPLVFDPEGAAAGKPFLQWRPELGTRIGLLPLDGGAPRWLETDPFFVFHFANGFERGREIVIDYVRHARLNLGTGKHGGEPPRLHRLTIDLDSGKLRNETLLDPFGEFPRIDDRLDGRPSRFVYLPTLTDSLRIEKPPSASFNTLLKIDPERGEVGRHDLGNRLAGEPVFIPKSAESDEDEGWLAVYAYDPEAASSDLVLLDASHIDAAPVAVIRMPQRVPQGLHGSWMGL